MSIPNMLSVLRLLLIPVFGYVYLIQGNSLLAAGILFLSGMTDVLDGYIARKYNMQTYAGVILDPLADKLTQAFVGICVMIRYPQIMFLIVFFFVKEICAGIGALYIVKKGMKIQNSKVYGKAATFAFYVVMGLLVLLPHLPDVVVYVMAGVCALLFLIAFLGYFKVFIEILRGKKSP